jgi:bifunctional non-homologous end joining protein LigD
VYPQIDSLEGLLGLVQMGTLEIHTWGSTAKDPEHPDQLVFDLDPGPDVLWARVLAVARQLVRLLEQLGLASFVKTSGGKGLHVVVPLRPQASWDQVKAFARGVAEHAAANDPEHLTTNMARARRQGRVFIDYLRNGRGATSVVAYSPRARPGAPVSAPLRWDELAPRVRAASFTVRSAPGRLRALRNDPWAGFEAARRPLPGI